MPNQLAGSKRRQSLAEHQAVLAALAHIAQQEGSTVMALLREGARAVVRQRATNPTQAKILQSLVWSMEPRMPARFKSTAQVKRFKRLQREFDQVALDLHLATPAAIQQRNSLVSINQEVRVVGFVKGHPVAAR